MPILRLSRLVLRTAISILLLIAILWAAAALWIDGPNSRALAGALAGAVLLFAALAAALVRPWWRAAVAVFAPFVLVLAWWLTLVPSNDRNWQADVAQLPTATIEGSLLTVRNLRNFAHRSETDITERARVAGDAQDFSKAIREGLPPRVRDGSPQAAKPEA